MFYLTNSDEIQTAIDDLTNYDILWIDTEIAHWNTPNPKLSLIQILADFPDLKGENVYLLDVFNKPELSHYFINKIMVNQNIEKVFYNAPFDIRYLGGKTFVKNVTCAYKMAQKIGKKRLNTSNLKLKTLAVEICNFPSEEIENEQSSDWGKRPLSSQQLKYAKMDVVYLASVHEKLLIINGSNKMFEHIFGKKVKLENIKSGYELDKKYKVIEKIGEGGFGATFLVKNITAAVETKYVAKALKLSDKPKDNQYLLNNFKKEAETLQKIGNSHGQIPALFDFFEFEGNFYLIQEYIEGQILEYFLDDGKFTIKNAIEIILSLLEIVDCLHQQKMIHRDIKPENIIIRKGDQKPVLIDFGIVKSLENTDLIKTGTIIGTNLYAPLEQLSGKATFASDLYSLGLVSLALITKSKEYINDLYNLKNKHQKTTKFDVENYQINFNKFFLNNKEIPEYLKSWLEKSLQLLPENRYTNAKKMRDDLLKIDIIAPLPPLNFNISQLKLAEECPRLFYLQEKNQIQYNWIKEEKSVEIDNLFQELTLTFLIEFHRNDNFQLIFNSENLDTINFNIQLQKLIYNLIIYPFITSNNVNILTETWQLLTKLIKLWSSVLVNNRKYYDSSNLLKNTFIRNDDFSNLILYDKHDQSLLFVDLEFNQSLIIDATTTQVALITHKLAQKLTIKSVNYVTLPNEKTITYSWIEIQNIITKITEEKSSQMKQWLTGNLDLIPPTNNQLFCLICPEKNDCKNLFSSPKNIPFNNSKNSSKEVTLPLVKTEKKTDINSQEIGEKLVTVLNSFGIEVTYLSSIIAPSFIRIKIKPELGVKVITITNKSSDLMVQLGLNSPPLIQPQPGFISVDIPRKNRETAYFEQYISSEENGDITNSLKIAIGVNLEGKLIEADLTDPNTCHFLVAGTTGSGKSEFLRALLLSLLVRYSDQDLKIVLVDPKRVTFPEFEQISWLYHPIIKEEELAINLMEELVEEMESRYKILERNKCNNIKTYNQKNNSQKIPHIVCIFDEYADFMAEKNTAKLLETSIKRLGAKARAAGIHLIIATQRPEAKIITPLIRSNLPGRVSLLTKAASESEMMLGSGNKLAAQLLGKGDLLYPHGTKIERLQSLFAHNFELK